MRVIRSKVAQRDLERIYAFGLGRFGKTAARQYIHELVAQFKFIGRWPRSSPIAGNTITPVRARPFKGHVILYREKETGIEIIRVASRFQNWPELT